MVLHHLGFFFFGFAVVYTVLSRVVRCTVLTQGKNAGTRWIGGWMGLKDAANAFKKKYSAPVRN
jgi:hypothetical protein